MNGVEYLVGNENITRTPLRAYSEEAVAFISDFSSRLLRTPASRAFPDIAALAFWGRKGNLVKLSGKCPEADKRLGRGVCFHVAPSNIPINFAFTYLFGVLAGCANIVRLPSKQFPQMDLALKEMRKVLEDHPAIKERTAFVRYPADNEITAGFSEIADARMIWGGDKTISGIRTLKTQPRCIDICFADRYSICILDGQAILDAEEEKIRRLSEDFYNDTYLMDQNACSSPQLIYWMNDSISARERFWDAVYETAQKKYTLQAAVSVDKYTKSCEDGIDHPDTISRITRRTNLLYRAEVEKLVPEVVNYRAHGGYFYEHKLNSLEEIVPVVTEKYQTITYFGVDPEEIRGMVLSNHLRGIDRIAPVGKAMDVGIIWDGFDLVRTLSRLVNVE